MSLANTIARTEARLANGEVVGYSDLDPDHVRRGRFQYILDGTPTYFTVYTIDGVAFSVDLLTGTLAVGDKVFHPEDNPPSPKRLIYYKRMVCSTGEYGFTGVGMLFFVVGWQTTYEGRNHKVGLKVYPDRQHVEVTGDI